MIKAIIVEDEPLAAEKLDFFLRDFPGIQVDGIFSDALSALTHINQNLPDLIFLDIQLPGINGMELAKSLSTLPVSIIFTTAYDQFAVEAFDVNAVAYLLKPFDRNRFISVMLKALQRFPSKNESEPAFSDQYPLKSGGKIRLITLSDILYIQADHNDAKLVTATEIYRQRITLSSLAEGLPSSRFIRVHKSFIVNKTAIREIEPLPNHEFILTLSGGKKIPTGRTYKESLHFLPGIPK
ncbi:MAG: LytTR family DNA-binding domain-containing protein [Bacteroidetes bacterium]|nr:LytTR family DNA-binding domain-containing protein [Bacteroidota bacterium]